MTDKVLHKDEPPKEPTPSYLKESPKAKEIPPELSDEAEAKVDEEVRKKVEEAAALHLGHVQRQVARQQEKAAADQKKADEERKTNEAAVKAAEKK